MYLRGTIHTSKTDLTDQEYSYNTNYFPSNYQNFHIKLKCLKILSKWSQSCRCNIHWYM